METVTNRVHAFTTPRDRQWRRASRTRLMAAAIAVTAIGSVAGDLTPLTAMESAFADTSTTYSTPGTYTYVVPPGTAEIAFTVIGAAGQSPSGSGGAAGLVSGWLAVTPGSTLTIDVGGYGTGLYPGGSGGDGVGAGGDASDIRGYVIAGGGGGGSGGNAQSYGGDAGYPNGGQGGFDSAGGGGGTQVSPGTGGTDNCGTSCTGNNGNGGAGGAGAGNWGGGGGGGYFGGGGGGGYRGGGGGSSWISGNVIAPSFTTKPTTTTGWVTLVPNGIPGIGALPPVGG